MTPAGPAVFTRSDESSLRVKRARLVPLTLDTMQFKVTTALPYDNRERATAELRAELRRQLLSADVYEMPLWETFLVTGPMSSPTCVDARGLSTEARCTAEDPSTATNANTFLVTQAS